MSETVITGLKKLDPTNDNHWTADKLPRLETVRLMAGDQSISREAVDAAAPGFSRDTAASYWLAVPEAATQAATGPAGAESAGGEGVSTAPQPGGAGAAPQAAETATGATEEAEGAGGGDLGGAPEDETEQGEVEDAGSADRSDEIEAAEAALAETRQELEDLRRERDSVSAAIDAANARETELLAKLETLDPPQKLSGTIQDYLASEKRKLEERGVRRNLIASSGLDLQQLAKDLKSPIDSAMARRTARGGRRPTRI